MKEVQFRTIDKLFIKMSINDKFWVIFLIIYNKFTKNTMTFQFYHKVILKIIATIKNIDNKRTEHPLPPFEEEVELSLLLFDVL